MDNRSKSEQVVKGLKSLSNFLEHSLRRNLYEFNPEKPWLPLMVPSYSSDEVLEAIDTLLSTNVTMGEKVFKFEEAFASYIGSRNAVMVNSGSSANLVALSTLTNPMMGGNLKAGFEAAIPAVTWPTTMFPINNCNGIPVLTDVDSVTFNLTPESVDLALSKKTGLVVPVHLLGNPCDVNTIEARLPDEKIKIVEDSCEAHGAEIGGKKVGTFGDIGTFSFFFSHHISTIEGGMVVTDNEEYAEVARMLRAHGWIRELKRKDEYARRHYSIDHRFLFVSSGFNLRPTEIQGAFGIHQLGKLEKFIEARRSNARFLSRRLKRYDSYIELQEERPGTRHVWFGYPITLKEGATFSRVDLVSFLEKRGIETRPIMGGNLADQPFMSFLHHRIAGPLRNAKRIMQHSFFFGNHQSLGREALEYIVSCFEDFFSKVSR